MLKKNFSRYAYLVMASCIFFISCKKKSEDPKPETEKPAPEAPKPIPVYTGNAANMASDTVRVGMIKNLVDVARGSASNPVSESSLTDRYYHTGTPFSYAHLNARKDIKIADAINPAYADTVVGYMKKLASASQSRGPASDGTAGVLMDSRNFPRFFDEKGLVLDELIEKGLTGSVQFYQIVQVKLADAKITSADTAANLKNWDNAFAQLGVPLNYGNKDYGYDLPLWGKYLKLNDRRLGGSISKIVNAFVEGRNAIVRGDNSATLSNSKTIKDELERVTASLVLTSLNNYKYWSERGANQEKLKSLSQALSFLHILRNRPANERKISEEDLNNFIDRLDNNSWKFTLNEAQDILDRFSAIYPGLNSTVDTSI